jgi:hypothetical protein
MLISRAQMRVLERQAEEAFELRLADLLRERYGATVSSWSDDDMRRRVRYAIGRARHHGFSWQSAIGGFVAIMAELGPRFDSHPAFARALAIRLPNENQRIEALYHNLSDEDWAAVRGPKPVSPWDRAGTMDT